MQFPKKYDPSFEQGLYASREEKGLFKPRKWTTWETFSMTLPPPNVTWVLHVGHAMMLAVEDTMVRYHRMKGDETLRVPGTDHASISTQVVVEKQLAKQDILRTDLWREKFLGKMREWVNYSRSTIISQSKRLWASLDRSREQFTMSEQLSRAVRKSFVDLYKREKIYKSQYMVNRSPKAETFVSDLEVIHKEEEKNMYYIRYFVQGKWDSITVATVRPDTIFGDVAIAVHPKDKRYKKWIGKNVLIPIVNIPIPIIADESVLMDFGTGALKITPWHAEADFDIAKKHELPLAVYSFDQQEIFTERAGELYEWKSIVDFWDNLIHNLNEIWNLEKSETVTSSVPYCERTGCRIQPMLSTQRFMDVQGASDQVLDAVHNDTVHIHPPRFKKTFTDRLENIRPRCISRQLRRWHRIPVWYDEDGTKYVFDEETVLTDTKDKNTLLSRIVFNLIADSRLVNPFNIEQLIEILIWPSLVPQFKSVLHSYIHIYNLQDLSKAQSQELEILQKTLQDISSQWNKDLIKAWETILDILENSAHIAHTWDCYEFDFLPGSEKKLTQDEDVLDTWFSSGLRPFTVMWRPDDKSQLEKYYPNTVLETGYDIIFFWVIRMMIMWVEITQKIPFENIYLHGLVKDKHGKKMSKSVWNVVNPLEIVEKYWTDALRWALISWNTPGTDLKFQDEKVEYISRFINKFWNASRFVMSRVEEWSDIISSFEELQNWLLSHIDECNDYDLWILHKTQELIKQNTKYLQKFMLGEALQDSIHTVRHDFCDWYIEISKLLPSSQTPDILRYCLGVFCKVIHPSLPFVTDRLRSLIWFEGELMISPRPIEQNFGKKNYKVNLLMDIISECRKLKQQATKKPHEKVHVYIQANTDIQETVTQHQDLIRMIVWVESLQCLHLHDQVEWDRLIWMVMDIKIWVQGIQTIDWKVQLRELEQQLKEEEQFLQRMRSMFLWDFADKAPANVVEAKRKKMAEVKSKISYIEWEIRRLKMLKK